MTMQKIGIHALLRYAVIAGALTITIIVNVGLLEGLIAGPVVGFICWGVDHMCSKPNIHSFSNDSSDVFGADSLRPSPRRHHQKKQK